MDKTIFIVGSVTNAIRGRDLLRTNGINAYTERTPNGLNQTGCGYNIIIAGNKTRAESLLMNAGIRILGVSGAN